MIAGQKADSLATLSEGDVERRQPRPHRGAARRPGRLRQQPHAVILALAAILMLSVITNVVVLVTR